MIFEHVHCHDFVWTFVLGDSPRITLKKHLMSQLLAASLKLKIRKHCAPGHGLWTTHLSLHIFISISISIFLYFSISLFLYFSIYVSMYLCIYVSMYLCIYVSIYLSIYLSISLSVYLSIYLSLYLSISLSVYLSIYLSIYLFSYPSIDLPFYLLLALHQNQKTLRIFCNPAQIVSGNSGRTWFMVQMPPTRMRLFKSQFYQRSLHVCFQKRRCLGCIHRSSTVCFSKSDCRTSSCVI